VSQGTRIFYFLIALLLGAAAWLAYHAEAMRRAPPVAPTEAPKP